MCWVHINLYKSRPWSSGPRPPAPWRDALPLGTICSREGSLGYGAASDLLYVMEGMVLSVRPFFLLFWYIFKEWSLVLLPRSFWCLGIFYILAEHPFSALESLATGSLCFTSNFPSFFCLCLKRLGSYFLGIWHFCSEVSQAPFSWGLLRGQGYLEMNKMHDWLLAI